MEVPRVFIILDDYASQSDDVCFGGQVGAMDELQLAGELVGLFLNFALDMEVGVGVDAGFYLDVEFEEVGIGV